jgi:hypothetical protein
MSTHMNERGPEAAQRTQDDAAERQPEEAGLVALVRNNPITAATLLASVCLGGVLGSMYLPAETYSPLRRAVGGGLLGGLSWLLVMVGRII